MTSSYRFAGSFLVRLAGLALAVVGALVLVLVVVVLTASLSTSALAGGLGLAALVGAVVLLLLARLRRRSVVRLDETGYSVRYIRGAGVRQARWQDVEDVIAPTIEGERCVLLRLRDGRTTTVPVDVLAGTAEAFVRDLQEHLDLGHGYRPLPRRGAPPGA